MIVTVDGQSRSVSVLDVDDLARLSVEFRHGDLRTCAEVLGALGEVGADHVWLAADRLRLACDREQDPFWQDRFSAMVRYARTRGWTDRTGSRLQAHLTVI
jgi:hypothetical protein